MINLFVQHINTLAKDAEVKELLHKRDKNSVDVDKEILSEIYNKELFTKLSQHINEMGITKELATVKDQIRNSILEHSNIDINNYKGDKEESNFKILFNIAFSEVLSKTSNKKFYFLTRSIMSEIELASFLLTYNSKFNYTKLEKKILKLSLEEKREVDEALEQIKKELQPAKELDKAHQKAKFEITDGTYWYKWYFFVEVL